MASTYLERAKTGTDGNRQIWTISVWVKRSALGSEQKIFSFGENISSEGNLYFDANDFLVLLNDYQNGGTNETDMKFRDTSAWYHIVWACDSTQADNANRWKVYVNGTQVTLTGSPTITLNGNGVVNAWSAHDLWIGKTARTQQTGVPDAYLDASLAHVHFIDGIAYDASAFGETDSTTGIWKPKTAPSVTYGTNGFFLKFENSGAMGTDSSGNGNNFSVSGNLTQTIDTPSNVFATMNPLDNYYNSSTFTNGNNTVQTATSTYTYNTSTLGVSKGKWYCEIEYDAETASFDNTLIGVASQFSTSNTQALGNNSNDWGYYARDGKIRNSNSSSAYGDTYTTGDVIGIALDLDNNKLYFAKNGTWQNSGDPTSGATGTGAISITDPASTIIGNYFIAISHYDSGSNATFKANFGNGYFGTTPVSSAQNPDDGIGIFEYDVPTGYRALCTKSINAEEYS